MAKSFNCLKNEAYKEVKEIQAKVPSYRLGQGLYNFFYSNFSDLPVFQNRDIDPFYDDSKIDVFLAEVEKEIEINK